MIKKYIKIFNFTTKLLKLWEQKNTDMTYKNKHLQSLMDLLNNHHSSKYKLYIFMLQCNIDILLMFCHNISNQSLEFTQNRIISTELNVHF